MIRRFSNTVELVMAPCCGRNVAGDMLIAADGVPIAARPRLADWICDGCIELLVRRGIVTREQIIAGASDA